MKDIQQTSESRVNNRAIRMCTVPIYGQNGSLTGIAGSTNDLSSITELENQLHTALIQKADVESAMAAMFDTNPYPNIMFDDKFNLIDCNPAAVEFMGFQTREDLFSGFHELMNKITQAAIEDGQPVITTFERLSHASEQGCFRFDSKIVLNNVMREMEVWLIRIPFKGSYAIAGYIFDRTETNRQTRALKQADELNKLQLTKLKFAVKAAKIGMWDMEIIGGDVVNPDNSFSWSDEFRQLLGFKDETDFPNLLSSWSDRLHPEDKAMTLSAFERHILDTSNQSQYDIEFRCLMKNGEYRYFHNAGETIRDEKGNPLHVVGAMMDITEIKKALFDTKEQKIKAEAANKAKSEFLSTISHEIRTPLNAILGITEIQLANEALDQSFKDAFERIYVSGDMLLRIINDLLDLSKIEAGKQLLEIADYEVASMLSDTVQINVMRIGSKPVIFEIDLDENIPAVLSGDELRVKQILNNVLTNAFKYTNIGMVKLQVLIECEPANLEPGIVNIVFIISDTGLGMTEEQTRTLFDEYSRFGKKENIIEGTGLGMSITQKLVKMMKGEIFEQSELGKGSIVTVRLPQSKVGSDVLGKEVVENLCKFRTSTMTMMKKVPLIREPMPYGRVLVVDDIETNLYVAKGLMAPYGLQIDIAHSGYEAIEKIESGNIYDIVFMDHIMPGIDGIETVQILRRMGYNLPIVALTANAVVGQIEIFLANGFDGFLSKSIDIHQLDAVLNRLIYEKQSLEVIEAAREQAAASSKIAAEKTELLKSLIQQGVVAQVLECFLRDADKFMTVLKAINEKGTYDENDKRLYIIHMHGIKGALANINRNELSAIALKLEMAMRAGDLNFISSETGSFLDLLQSLVEELEKLAVKEEAEKSEFTYEDQLFLREKLLVIKTACQDYDEVTADDTLAELREKRWSKPVNDLLSSIAGYLLRGYFEETSDIIDNFVGR